MTKLDGAINKYLLIAVTLSVALIPVSSVFSIVSSLVLIALLLTHRLKSNLVLSAVLGLIGYGILGALLMHVSDLIFGSIYFDIIFALLAVSTVAVYAKAKVSVASIRSGSRDLIHGFFLFAATLLLILPLIGASDSKRIDVIRLGGTEDTSSQMQMYHYIVKEKKFAYGNTKEDTGIRESLTSYPQGSHAAIALYSYPFVDEAATGGHNILYFYFAGLTVFYVLCSYLVFAAITWPLKKKTQGGVVAELFAAGAVMFLVNYGITLNLFAHSYLGQIAAYLGLLYILIAIIMTDSFTKDPKSRTSTYSPLAVSGIVLGFFLVYTSWYLIAPVAIVPLVGYVIMYRKSLLNDGWRLLLPASVMAVVGVYLARVYLFTSTSSGHILITGGSVERIRSEYMILLFPVFILSVWYLRKKRFQDAVISSTILASIGLTALIGAYHRIKIGQFEYYFYKTMYTFILLTIMFLGYKAMEAWAPQINKIKTIGVEAKMLIACLVIIAVAALPQISGPLSEYVDLKYDVPEVDRVRLLDTTFYDYSQYDDVLYLGACHRYHNFLATIWSGTVHLGYLPGRNDLEGRLLHADQYVLASTLKEYSEASSRNGVRINVIGDCDKEALAELSNVPVFDIDYQYQSIKP